MAVISRGGYAIAIEKVSGVYRIVKAHKKFTRAKETLRKFMASEPDTNWVMVKELDGCVFKIWYPLEMSSEED